MYHYPLLPIVNGRPAYGATFTAALGGAYGATYPTRTAARRAARALRLTPPTLPYPATTPVDYALGVVPGPRGLTRTVAATVSAGSLTLITFSDNTSALALGVVPRVGTAYRVYAGRYPYVNLVPARATYAAA